MPQFINGEFKFAQINWHAIGFKDKLRFEEEVDRACEARNKVFTELQERVSELEEKLKDRDAVVAAMKEKRREDEFQKIIDRYVDPEYKVVFLQRQCTK